MPVFHSPTVQQTSVSCHRKTAMSIFKVSSLHERWYSLHGRLSIRMTGAGDEKKKTERNVTYDTKMIRAYDMLSCSRNQITKCPRPDVNEKHP